MRRFALVFLALATALVACDGGGTTGPIVPPPPPPITLVRVAVVGDSTQERVGSFRYRCLGKYSDGTEKELICTWSSDDHVGKVDSVGLVTLWALGTLRVTASYQGVSETLSVRMTGTPWSKLPPISEGARKFVLDYNVNYTNYRDGGGIAGVVERWPEGSIAVFASSEFSRGDLQKATAFWEELTSSKVKFRIVDNPMEARIVFDAQWPPPGNSEVPANACGVEGPSKVEGGLIVSGNGHYNPQCAVGPIGLAHGLGHVLGLGGHTPSGSDLMGSPNSVWGETPLLSEVINWLYSVPPGTWPVL